MGFGHLQSCFHLSSLFPEVNLMMTYLNFISVGKTSITIIAHRNQSARFVFTFWVAVSLVSGHVLTEVLPLPSHVGQDIESHDYIYPIVFTSLVLGMLFCDPR